jgi:hypothetical protein
METVKKDAPVQASSCDQRRSNHERFSLDKLKKFTTMYYHITLKERYVRDFGPASRELSAS